MKKRSQRKLKIVLTAISITVLFVASIYLIAGCVSLISSSRAEYFAKQGKAYKVPENSIILRPDKSVINIEIDGWFVSNAVLEHYFNLCDENEEESGIVVRISLD